MSDVSIAIVPKASRYPDREQKAGEILQWLIRENIVAAETSGCTLGEEGHILREGAAAVVTEPSLLPVGLDVNGMEIITERQVFHTGQFGLDEVNCPACNKNIANSEEDRIGQWADDESDELICPHCGHSAEIHQFNFDPSWGFSDLGFVFWNWPELTPAFIDEFRKRLNCDVDIVYCKI